MDGDFVLDMQVCLWSSNTTFPANPAASLSVSGIDAAILRPVCAFASVLAFRSRRAAPIYEQPSQRSQLPAVFPTLNLRGITRQ